MTTLDRILALIEKNGIEQQQLSDYLGVNKQVITDWKSGKSKSYRKYIGKIAEFFNVSSDYLQGIKIADESTAQNKTEKRFLLLARKATDIPDPQREAILKNFEDTIDIYLQGLNQNKKDK